jgi:hypothetical protein
MREAEKEELHTGNGQQAVHGKSTGPTQPVVSTSEAGTEIAEKL